MRILIVFLAISAVSVCDESQQLITCHNNFFNNMDVSGPQCDGYHDYVKCVLREMKAEEKLITEQKIRIAQNLHDSLMFKLGINCSLDVTRILEEIRQENLTNETEETTRRAVGFTDAVTYNECMNVFSREVVVHGATCGLTRWYIKCIIRVGELYKYLSETGYMTFETSMRDQLLKNGISCTLNFRELFEEVAIEQLGDAYSTSGVLTDRKASTSSSDSLFIDANTMDDCKMTLMKLVKEKHQMFCSDLKSGIKCVIRVTDFYKYDDANNDYETLQGIIDALEKEHHVVCTDDARAIVQEVRHEEGWNSGINHGTNQTFYPTLIMFMLLSKFLVYN